MAYGSDVTWNAGEAKAFMEFNRLCREQAKAVFAWDAAKVDGQQVGKRPAIVPAAVLTERARGIGK